MKTLSGMRMLFSLSVILARLKKGQRLSTKMLKLYVTFWHHMRKVRDALSSDIACLLTFSASTVQKVFYPKYVCREYYDAVKHKTEDAGYGGLFSVLLKDEKSAAQFFDNLKCAKGPSLGTNFTLACPYTILAHYTELDWANEYGVSRFLVRVSVGLEDREKLLSMFKQALDAVN